ncbi:MAG: aminotransferase class I/II-fold pyridoxal phosphate-dependent enzyme [Chloroflexi bacterium]|nr:aminotransferase class I/II-fold pyridoxal phosphate-dependent enzyme [Chloroflexota bacterium]
MSSAPVASRIAGLATAMQPFLQFMLESPYLERAAKPGVSDFAIGNPHEMPLAQYTEVLQEHIAPQDKNWFAYKLSEPEAQQVVAESLRQWKGLAVQPEDVAMTNGAFAALQLALQTVVNPGDEVLMMVPPWFFYEMQIRAVGGVPVRVRVDPETFDLDLEAIEVAITDRTRAIIVNSPNNPTGKIYPAETLQALAALLEAASRKNGRAIYLISDEAYSRIIYDGRTFVSPATLYANTLLIYTYGKTLLTPGQRIGYIALPEAMEARAAVRQAILVSQLAGGFSFPNALLQHALADLEKLSIDIEHLQFKRDWLVRDLRALGYDVHSPEGTFYLLPRSPIADDWQFTETLAQHNVLCLPGSVVEMPGYFRMSLTANDGMIERALPNFGEAMAAAL